MIEGAIFWVGFTWRQSRKKVSVKTKAVTGWLAKGVRWTRKMSEEASTVVVVQEGPEEEPADPAQEDEEAMLELKEPLPMRYFNFKRGDVEPGMSVYDAKGKRMHSDELQFDKDHASGYSSLVVPAGGRLLCAGPARSTGV